MVFLIGFHFWIIFQCIHFRCAEYLWQHICAKFKLVSVRCHWHVHILTSFKYTHHGGVPPICRSWNETIAIVRNVASYRRRCTRIHDCNSLRNNMYWLLSWRSENWLATTCWTQVIRFSPVEFHFHCMHANFHCNTSNVFHSISPDKIAKRFEICMYQDQTKEGIRHSPVILPFVIHFFFLCGKYLAWINDR